MLDETLFQERLALFKPEPLIDHEEHDNEILEIPMVEENENVIDLAKANYLNVLNNEDIKETSENIIRKYGVGTCGPRAFYGTTDIHLDVEDFISNFLEVEQTIVYSYGFVAISSSIAAYTKRNDVVFIDEEANFPILQGLKASKSHIIVFSHNNPTDLREKVAQFCAGENKKRARKFLIVEGISWKTGKLCPLPEFLEIAEEFKMRVFLEESYSFGVLGDNGRGLTEHFNVDRSRVDMIFGTLEGAVGSIGGFCSGSNMAIEHQRLSGSGYIFSASLPTYLAKVVIRSIELFGDKPKRLVKLAEEVHGFLEDTCKFKVISDAKAPFKMFTVDCGSDERKAKEHQIHEYCKKQGVHFIEKDNGLCINLNVELSDNKERLRKVYDTLEAASKSLN